jgi:cytochrome c oxidase cbb3-type subunit 1
MNQSQSTKWMTNGEAGLAVFFSASTCLYLIAAAKALDTAFAFHASLGAVASLTAAFAIFNRYFDHPSSLPPGEINGRPNYNLGPIKFAAAISAFWGIAGFTSGC